ncbi:MAG: hypothetical protein JRJ75_11090 [Deltaproteobacteria bacterium]|nr:hypothetical protein [Deltaproteobacteria bacterium]
MRLADVRRRLRGYDKASIHLKRHVTEEKCPYYGIPPGTVLENLLNPRNLIRVSKTSININEDKYKLYFRLSRQRILVVVAEFNEKLKVITIYLVISRWQKRVVPVWKE